MARGQQKIQAQQKNANKGKEKGSQLGSHAAALKVLCPICKISTTDYGTMTNHYEAK
jgi:hypothetical protein